MKLPAIPKVEWKRSLNQRTGEYIFTATASIKHLEGHGRGTNLNSAMNKAIISLKSKLYSQLKARKSTGRIMPDGKWRYARLTRDWGTVFGYGETLELAHKNYLHNVEQLSKLLEAIDPTPKSDPKSGFPKGYDPKMDQLPEKFYGPSNHTRWWQFWRWLA